MNHEKKKHNLNTNSSSSKCCADLLFSSFFLPFFFFFFCFRKQAAQDKKTKRKSASVSNLQDAMDGPKDDLSERDWQILLTGSAPKKFKNGQVIIKVGAPNEYAAKKNLKKTCCSNFCFC